MQGNLILYSIFSYFLIAFIQNRPLILFMRMAWVSIVTLLAISCLQPIQEVKPMALLQGLLVLRLLMEPEARQPDFFS